MKREDIIKKIEEMHPDLIAEAKFENQIDVIIPNIIITSFLHNLKMLGFKHLVNITAVDWIDEKSFEVVYNLWSYSEKIHITVKTRVRRDRAELPTIGQLWPHGYVYERELHEMFGITFQGNPDLSPLFLHNWQDIPPLRKDFDTEEYAIKTYKNDKS
jgi:NADH-quinone oxidoreductase subunit C